MPRRLFHRVLALPVFLAFLAAVVAVAFWRQEGTWLESSPAASEPPHAEESASLELSPQARKNLGLTSEALQLTTWWRTIDVPGVITDRPGVSDRGVVAPVTGVVTQIHAYPATRWPQCAAVLAAAGQRVAPPSQLELFKATKEIEIARQQKQRLEGLAASGGVPVRGLSRSITRSSGWMSTCRPTARTCWPEACPGSDRGGRPWGVRHRDHRPRSGRSRPWCRDRLDAVTSKGNPSDCRSASNFVHAQRRGRLAVIHQRSRNARHAQCRISHADRRHQPDAARLRQLSGDHAADRRLSRSRPAAGRHHYRVPRPGDRRSRNAGHAADRDRPAGAAACKPCAARRRRAECHLRRVHWDTEIRAARQTIQERLGTLWQECCPKASARR
jgi:hypothetical protein